LPPDKIIFLSTQPKVVCLLTGKWIYQFNSLCISHFCYDAYGIDKYYKWRRRWKVV